MPNHKTLRRWTEEEEKLLFSKLSTKEIAKMINRTIRAVAARRTLIGASKTKGRVD